MGQINPVLYAYWGVGNSVCFVAELPGTCSNYIKPYKVVNFK